MAEMKTPAAVRREKTKKRAPRGSDCCRWLFFLCADVVRACRRRMAEFGFAAVCRRTGRRRRNFRSGAVPGYGCRSESAVFVF